MMPIKLTKSLVTDNKQLTRQICYWIWKGWFGEHIFIFYTMC
jgi:hypothetical protein